MHCTCLFVSIRRLSWYYLVDGIFKSCHLVFTVRLHQKLREIFYDISIVEFVYRKPEVHETLVIVLFVIYISFRFIMSINDGELLLLFISTLLRDMLNPFFLRWLRILWRYDCLTLIGDSTQFFVMRLRLIIENQFLMPKILGKLSSLGHFNHPRYSFVSCLIWMFRV